MEKIAKCAEEIADKHNKFKPVVLTLIAIVAVIFGLATYTYETTIANADVKDLKKRTAAIENKLEIEQTVQADFKKNMNDRFDRLENKQDYIIALMIKKEN